MWGTVLSDPLAIVALVGRRPANKLMARMPVPSRVSASPGKGCPPPGPWRIIRRFHRLSACRGLVAYALRTRAPLSCLPKEAIPFDLHVLGLPLAFILSQDQTLRCNIVLLFVVFSVSRVPPPQGPRPRIAARTAPRLDCSLSGIPKALRPRDACAGLRISKNSRPRLPHFLALRPSRKRVQKYNLFPSPQ